MQGVACNGVHQTVEGEIAIATDDDTVAVDGHLTIHAGCIRAAVPERAGEADPQDVGVAGERIDRTSAVEHDVVVHAVGAVQIQAGSGGINYGQRGIGGGGVLRNCDLRAAVDADDEGPLRNAGANHEFTHGTTRGARHRHGRCPCGDAGGDGGSGSFDGRRSGRQGVAASHHDRARLGSQIAGESGAVAQD